MKEGLTLISRCPINEEESVVLYKKEGFIVEYVTWIENKEGATFWGHYNQDYKEALKDYGKRIAQ